MNQPELATCQCIIAHPSQPKFMAIKHTGGHLPPTVKVPLDAELGPNIAKVTAGIERKYGLQTTALRMVARLPSYYCIELELHGNDSRRLQAVWVGPDDYARIRGTNPGAADPITYWLDERARGEVPPRRPPWEFHGWFKHARHWIDIELDRLHIQSAGSVQQIRALSHSATILRVPTSEGSLFFKASYERAPREAPLTQFLFDHWPGRVTEVLALDKTKNWMLMRGPNIEEQSVNRSERYARGAAALASIQVESIGKLDELRMLGCETFGVDQLRQFLLDESLPSSIPSLDTAGLSQEAREQVGVLAPRLAELCEKLAGYSIPETLIHEDFQSPNFFVSSNAVQIIDWQRSCIGHPFFSLLTLARYDRNWALDRLDEDPVICSYLACFADFESVKNLHEAMQLVCRLFLAWRLWYRMRELPYYEPDSFALLRAQAVISDIASRLVESNHS